MKRGDTYLTPVIDFTDTKSNIEALTSPVEGMRAITTDTHESGFYNGSAWVWGSGGGGSVESVTGDGVDNTDPTNPVIAFPAPADIGAATSAQGALADSALQSIVAGTNITVDVTDPENPIINSSGGSVAPATTAENDFQVGDGLGAWIKKTLAEISTILRTSLDGVYTKLSSMSAANAALLVGGSSITLHTHPASGGTVTNIATTAPITGGPITSSGTIAISAATTSAAGSMSASDKTKLNGIATGAEVNVNPDWNAVSGDALILNKPTITPAQVVVILSDVKPSGTSGGTAIAGLQTRTLNTISASGSGYCTLGTNQFTLVAGTWEIQASAPARCTDSNKVILYNVTNNISYAGVNSTASNVYYGASFSAVNAVFTLAGSTTFEVQHWFKTAFATTGRGTAASSGYDEVYTVVICRKIK